MKPSIMTLSNLIQKLPIPFETKRKTVNYLVYLRAKNILRNKDKHDAIFVDAARTLVSIKEEEE